MGNKIDLTNMRFGKLTVIKKAGVNKHREIMWLCKCDCGKEHIVSGYCLRSGMTKSCGCRRHDVFMETFHKHGLAKTRLYRIWSGIKNRCYNTNEPAYKWYGARGITMCDDWKNNPVDFYEWSINNGYSNELSIDRIDNNGDYTPMNCRWVDVTVQCNNRRNNRYYTYQQETHTLGEWSKITGISYHVIYDRVNRYKWDIGRALTVSKRDNQ